MMVLSVFLKMLVFSANWQLTELERISIFGNLLVLMTGVYLGIKNFKSTIQEKTSYLQDVKSGMRIASLYALFMSAFVYLYYGFIDRSYFVQKAEQRIELLEQQGIDIEQANASMELVFTPFFQSTITLMGFILLGSFYAAMIAFLLRKFKR